MSERYIQIRNWDRFQHKDVWRKSGGRPPWIKNYTVLLHDDDYMDLSWSQRGILHGLWLMYASAGRAVSENRARTQLARNAGEARHFLGHIEALSDAGFIEFVSQPARAPVAPRVEESREETLSKDQRTPEPNPILAIEKAEKENHRGNGWVENLNAYTGCRYVRGEFALTAVYDPLGTEPTPQDWSYARPTKDEVRKALDDRANGKERDIARAS